MPISLFKINDAGVAELTPEARTIECFKRIITRDKGSKGDSKGLAKVQATKELAFVYWYAKFDSPYEQYEEYDKKEKLKKALGLESDWKVDKELQECIDTFSELQKTKSMIHLDSVDSAVNKLSKYLKETDISETIKSGPSAGQLVHDLNKYKNLAKELPDLIESYQKTKELVKKEIQEETQVRAAKVLNRYNK